MQFKHHTKAEVGRAILLILYTFFSVYFDARNFVFTDGSSYLLYAVLKLLQLVLIAMLLRKMEMVWRTRCLDGTLRIALKLFVIFTIGLSICACLKSSSESRIVFDGNSYSGLIVFLSSGFDFVRTTCACVMDLCRYYLPV